MQLFDEHDLAQPSRLTESHARLLIALAELDCSKHVLAALLSPAGLHEDHIRFLTGPVVQHRSQWAETTPEWLYRAVTAGRLRIILDEHERREVGRQVGPAELTAVMYPASMDAPLAIDYADIYLWAAAQANARHYGKTVAEMWSAVGGDPVEDRLITDPSGRYYHTYRQLCSDIRRRVVKAASAASRPGKTPAQKSAVITEQLALF